MNIYQKNKKKKSKAVSFGDGKELPKEVKIFWWIMGVIVLSVVIVVILYFCCAFP